MFDFLKSKPTEQDGETKELKATVKSLEKEKRDLKEHQRKSYTM